MLVVNDMLVTFIYDNKAVGYMIIAKHNEYDYCEYLEIYPQYRGMGYATKAIDEYRNLNSKSFRYSITHSNSSGEKFWNDYTKDKVVTKIKGLTYEISI